MTLSAGDDWPEDVEGLASDGQRELLARAIVNLAEERDIDVPDAETIERMRADVHDLERDVETVERDVNAIERDVDGIEDDVGALRTELEEQITDVRNRVIQVLEEVESRAPKDHEHADVEAEIDDLATAVDDLSSRLDGLEGDLESADSVSDSLAAHDERISEFETKLTRVAKAVVSTQRRLGKLEALRSRRKALEDILSRANHHGITKAACRNCEDAVYVGLLAKPRCPHCDTPFESVEPKSGFFGKPWLTIGDRPALEGEVDGPEAAADILEDDDG